MSFKVIQGHRFRNNRKPICDFLLVINSNLPHLEPFLSYGRLLVKFSVATGECLTFTLSLGVIPANIWINFTSRETWMIVLPDAENRTMYLSSFVWTKHRNVMEGQTDRQNRSGYYSGLHSQCRRAVIKSLMCFSVCAVCVCAYLLNTLLGWTSWTFPWIAA